jgi:hypothetical protein
MHPNGHGTNMNININMDSDTDMDIAHDMNKGHDPGHGRGQEHAHKNCRSRNLLNIVLDLSNINIYVSGNIRQNVSFFCSWVVYKTKKNCCRISFK